MASAPTRDPLGNPPFYHYEDADFLAAVGTGAHPDFRPRAWIDELPGLDAASSQPEDASLGRATRWRGGVPRPSG